MVDDIEQFQILEEKIDSLIDLISSLKKQNEYLSEKNEIQQEKITDLNGRLENLKTTRDRAKQKIVLLLEKIEQEGL
jgi:hypothetical protein